MTGEPCVLLLSGLGFLMRPAACNCRESPRAYLSSSTASIVIACSSLYRYLRDVIAVLKMWRQEVPVSRNE